MSAIEKLIKKDVNFGVRLPELLDWKKILSNLKPGDEYGFSLEMDGAFSAVAFGRGGIGGKVTRTTSGYDVELRGVAGGGAFAKVPMAQKAKALGQGQIRVLTHFNELPGTQDAVTRFLKQAPGLLRHARKTGEILPAATLLGAGPSWLKGQVTCFEVGVGAEVEALFRGSLGDLLGPISNLPNMPKLPKLPSNARGTAELEGRAMLSLVRNPDSGAQELVLRVGVEVEGDAGATQGFIPRKKTEADLNGTLVYERHFPVGAAEVQSLAGQNLAETLPALFEQVVTRPQVSAAPPVESLQLCLSHTANDDGARSHLTVACGARGFDPAALRQVLQTKSVSEVLSLIPRLGDDATLTGVTLPQKVKDIELNPRVWVLDGELDAYFARMGTKPLWKYSGPVKSAQTVMALKAATLVLGKELKAELDDFINFGENKRRWPIQEGVV